MDVNEVKNMLISKLEELETAYPKYVKANIDYVKKKSELWLDTDFVKELDSKRPTVDEKKAYVNMNLLDEKMTRDELYYNIEFLQYDIRGLEKILEVCDE